MALAIGTLSGDALLHLFPHALLADMDSHQDGHSNHEKFHQKSVWKGFAAMLSVLFFFLAEQLINMIGYRRKQKKEVEKAPVELTYPGQGRNGPIEDGGGGENGGVVGSHGATTNEVEVAAPPAPQVRVVLSGHRASDRSYGQQRLCKHKYSSFCVDDVYDAKQPPSSERRNTEIATLMAGTDTTDTLLQAAASDGKDI